MWKYTCSAGEYYNVSLIGLVKDIVVHRFSHWKKGEGWVD